MKEQQRKPPRKVRTIRGEPALDDVITQAELANGSELQITAWKIERECQEYMKNLATRQKHGARIEPGKLTWDGENEMVRSRKRKEA